MASMKKIVFADIAMKEKVHAVCYKGTGNALSQYEKPVVYPVNAILAEDLSKDDEVKAVLVQTQGEAALVEANTKIFIEELEEANKSIGAKISWDYIVSDFDESKQNHEGRLMAMLSKIKDERGAALYGDITFGPRTVPMAMLCAFSFAEKFFDARIKQIVYGKVEWENNAPKNPGLYDITSLYYLNSLTFNMQSSSAEKALKSLETFFSL